ncbi:MAG: hypothetical protein E7097_06250 [Bacteroides sp.]|nr:hypothetical protein [Bacteroides sp.]
MKNLSIVCVVVVAFWIGKCTQKNEKFTDLLFEKNVEALAGVDDDRYKYCYGSGKVDCYDGTKVERQSTVWGLGDNIETE